MLEQRATERRAESSQREEGPMFHKMVLALDGSSESKRAATAAVALATQLRSEVIVVHVKEMWYSGAAIWSPEPYMDLDAFLGDVVEQLESEGVQARRVLTEAPHGHVGKAIAHLATEESADLIVVGSSVHSELSGLPLGNVASRTLHLAHCSVLIVK